MNHATLVFLNYDNSYTSKTKRIHIKNKNMLLNRWVPPAVSQNDDLYIIDDYNYSNEYTILEQKDIIKHADHATQYKQIQHMLLDNTFFSKYDLKKNKAFNFIEYTTGCLYECRILYAYFNTEEIDVNDISWRVFVDELNVNIVMTTFMIKKLIGSIYSNYVIQLIIHDNNPKPVITPEIIKSKFQSMD